MITPQPFVLNLKKQSSAFIPKYIAYGAPKSLTLVKSDRKGQDVGSAWSNVAIHFTRIMHSVLKGVFPRSDIKDGSSLDFADNAAETLEKST